MTELSAEKYAIYCKLKNEFDNHIKQCNITNKKWDKIEKFYGMKYIMEQCKYDVELIKNVMSEYYSKSVYDSVSYRIVNYRLYIMKVKSTMIF